MAPRRGVARAGRRSQPPELRVVQAKIAASLGGLSPRGPVKPRESTTPLQSENWPGLRLLLEDSLSERPEAELRQARRAPLHSATRPTARCGLCARRDDGSFAWCASAPRRQEALGGRFQGTTRRAARRRCARSRCFVVSRDSSVRRQVRGSRARGLWARGALRSLRPSVGSLCGTRAASSSFAEVPL